MNLERVSSDRAVPLVLALLVFLSSGGLLGLDGLFYDDTAWLISAYSTDSLAAFLDTGFNQMGRPLMGTFLYYFFGLHKALPHAAVHLLWDLSIMAVSFGAALALFHLARRVMGRGTFAPFLAAALLAIHPIDTTLPIYTHINYRMGVLFALLSLLMTHMAVVERARRRLLLGTAVLLSTLGYFVFIEGVVAYEAARLLLIWFALGERDGASGGAARLRQTLLLASPFLAPAIALVALKLAFPTTGLYEGTYAMSAANLLSPEMAGAVLKAALLSSWTYVLPHGLRYGPFPVMLGLAVAAGLFALLPRAGGRRDEGEASVRDSLRTVLLGLLLFVPPAVLYLLVGKVPTPGAESRHGIVLEPGWALLMGGLVALALSQGRKLARAVALVAALVVGLGVFASNLSIDIYQETFDREIMFWEAFVERFPTLPERAPVIFDIQLGGKGVPEYPRIAAYYHYQIEFPLDLLYSPSRDPGGFRAHPALERWFPRFALFSNNSGFLLNTVWGRTLLIPDRAIFVHYRNGELLVNNEIAARYKGLPYQALLDRPAPTLPPPFPSGFPFRDRIARFFASPQNS